MFLQWQHLSELSHEAQHNKPAYAKTSSKHKPRKITHTFAFITFMVTKIKNYTRFQERLIITPPNPPTPPTLSSPFSSSLSIFTSLPLSLPPSLPPSLARSLHLHLHLHLHSESGSSHSVLDPQHAGIPTRTCSIARANVAAHLTSWNFPPANAFITSSSFKYNIR